MWGWKKKNTFIFRCDFNGVITDEPTVMTAGQEARRVALNVRNWQKHQNVQLPLGLFVTESLLCCHHRLARHTLSSHEKLKLPIRRPASHYMLNQFPFVENFCQKCASAAAGNRRQGTSGEETYCCRCIASTTNSDLHFDFYDTRVLYIGILTSKARRRKMTMMDLTLVWTTLTTTTWTSTKWRCIRPPCMTPRKDPLRGVFQTFFYK